jgi:hypothetical protein
MTKRCSGVANLPNPVEKNNNSMAFAAHPSLYNILIFMAIILPWGVMPASMAAVPVALSWQVDLAPGTTYTLEISSDKGFGQIVGTEEVSGGRSFDWSAPEEGVYHWRLLRPTREPGAERNTFLSGSFVAIDSGVKRDRPAIVNWTAEPKADRYKIFVLEGGIKKRIMVTSSNTFFVPQLNVSLMLEVVPYRGGQRVNQFFHFDPSLSLRSGAALATELPDAPKTPVVAATEPENPPELTGPPEPMLAEEEQPEDPESSPEEQTETAPEPVAEEEPTEEPGPTDETEANLPVAVVPVHQVGAFFSYTNESLRAQKLEVDLLSEERIAGIGAYFASRPFGGILLSGSATYHEHIATVSQDEFFSNQTLDIQQSRYTVDIGLGWNLFYGLDLHQQELSISLVSVLMQLPHLPLEFNGSPGSLPSLSAEQYNLFGFSVRYGYYEADWSISLEGGLAQLNEDEAKVSWQRIMAQYYIAQEVSIDAGVFGRLSSSKDCHANSSTCLLEGEVRTTSKEQGFLLGAGYSL